MYRILFALLTAAILAPGCGNDGDPGPCNGSGPCCGDGEVNFGLGEDCDGDDLAGATCEDYGYAGGTVVCARTCELDLTGCTYCGDGTISGTDVCDGTDLGVHTCTYYGFSGGTMLCTATCDATDPSGCT